jgi:hypothetical protein
VMDHFKEVVDSEGFAWGVVFGLGISLTLDFIGVYLKSRGT